MIQIQILAGSSDKPSISLEGFLIAYSLHCLLILTKKCPKASKRHFTLTLDWGEGGSLYTMGNLMVCSHIHVCEACATPSRVFGTCMSVLWLDGVWH